MSAGIWLPDGTGVNRKVRKVIFNEQGVQRVAKSVWVNTDGVNRKIYSSEITCTYTYSINYPENGTITEDTRNIYFTSTVTSAANFGMVELTLSELVPIFYLKPIVTFTGFRLPDDYGNGDLKVNLLPDAFSPNGVLRLSPLSYRLYKRAGIAPSYTFSCNTNWTNMESRRMNKIRFIVNNVDLGPYSNPATMTMPKDGFSVYPDGVNPVKLLLI